MATYEYRCTAHGAFTVHRPMGTASGAETCPSCGGDAARVFTAPLVARTPAALAGARAAEDRSRDRPDVVTEVPSAAPRSRSPHNPAWSQLPRP
jgi:putative FmdB family regulatory protein